MLCCSLSLYMMRITENLTWSIYWLKNNLFFKIHYYLFNFKTVRGYCFISHVTKESNYYNLYIFKSHIHISTKLFMSFFQPYSCKSAWSSKIISPYTRYTTNVLWVICLRCYYSQWHSSFHVIYLAASSLDVREDNTVWLQAGPSCQ